MNPEQERQKIYEVYRTVQSLQPTTTEQVQEEHIELLNEHVERILNGLQDAGKINRIVVTDLPDEVGDVPNEGWVIA
jgi:ferric iron reductase protein FhuF